MTITQLPAVTWNCSVFLLQITYTICKRKRGGGDPH